MMVMIGHGLSTGALFLLVGMIYERKHSREIADYGGIAKVVPVFARCSRSSRSAASGSRGRTDSSPVPGAGGFVQDVPYLTTISALGVILAAAYLLWALQRIITIRSTSRPTSISRT
jgi:NADH-quinone oxidoreductase subunit M